MISKVVIRSLFRKVVIAGRQRFVHRSGITPLLDTYTDADAVDAMGIKANSNALNHDRYTDAEASAAAPVQADDARLTDARTPTSHGNAQHSATFVDAAGAVAAMNAKGDNNPLNHDRYTDGEAQSALSDHTGSTSNPHSVTAAQAGAVAIAKWTWLVGQYNAGNVSGAITLVSGNGHTQYCIQTDAATDPLAITWTAGYLQISVRWNDTLNPDGGPNLSGYNVFGTIPAEGIYWITFESVAGGVDAHIGTVES